MTYKIEFPDYDDTITLPEGWRDVSWHNDICPSFEKDFNELAEGESVSRRRLIEMMILRMKEKGIIII
jgi:hypothetical protein